MSPAANTSLTPYNPTPQFNFSISSAPKSKLFITLDGNLTFSVLLEFDGSSHYYPAPTNPLVSDYYNITDVAEPWVPFEFNLTLLDGVTNATTNYSTMITGSSWVGDIRPSYSLFVFEPTDVYWHSVSNEDQSLYCAWTAAGQNRTMIIADHDENDQFTCAFQSPRTWQAGDSVEMSLVLMTFIDANNTSTEQKLDGTGIEQSVSFLLVFPFFLIDAHVLSLSLSC